MHRAANRARCPGRESRQLSATATRCSGPRSQVFEVASQRIAVLDQNLAQDEELGRRIAHENLLPAAVEQNRITRFVDEVMNRQMLVPAC